MQWTEVYLPLVKKRNTREVCPFDAIVEEHTALQRECARMCAELKVLRDANKRLTDENELLGHDLHSAGHAKGSAPRVKSLEAQVEALHKDLDDYRRSQQRVVTRYDDDLSEAKRLLEQSAEREKRLQREVEELGKRLQNTSHDLHSTRETLEKTSTELEATERERETLALESQRKQDSMQHVKIKSISKAVEEFKAHQDSKDLQRFVRQNSYLQEVVSDALEIMGTGSEQSVADALAEGYTEVKGVLGVWVAHISSEVRLYVDVLLKKETWCAADSEIRSRGLRLLMPKVATFSEFFTSSCFPCACEWDAYCAIAADAVTRCTTAATAFASLPSLAYRLNTILRITAEYTQLLTRLSEEWSARPTYAKGGAIKVSSLLLDTASSTHAFAVDMCAQIATRAVAAVQRMFDELYVIDMHHYKKYKHKDAYTKHNKHLKQANTMSAKMLIEALETSLSATPVEGPEQLGLVYVNLMKEVCTRCSALLLSGGPTRWYYPEQAAALEEDLTRLKRYFTSRGVAKEVVSKQFSRISAIVTTVMSQTTEHLISGGGLCLQFSELPEESKGSVWSRATVQQVLAHRKDKKAKQFTQKQAKKKKISQ